MKLAALTYVFSFVFTMMTVAESISVSTWDGRQFDIDSGSISCGCNINSHGRYQLREPVDTAISVLFLKTPQYTVVIPFSYIDTIIFSIPGKHTQSDKTVQHVFVKLGDGTTLEGRMLNSGPLIGKIEGRDMAIPIDTIKQITGFKGYDLVILDCSGMGKANLITQSIPHREWLPLNHAGFTNARGCATGCNYSSRVADSLPGNYVTARFLGIEKKERIYINWESIKSLTIAPNSAKIRKPWSLFVEKQGGDIVYIEPVSVTGVAGLARFGSYTTPVIIPYSSGSLRLEVEVNEEGEKEKEREEEGHALHP